MSSMLGVSQRLDIARKAGRRRALLVSGTLFGVGLLLSLPSTALLLVTFVFPRALENTLSAWSFALSPVLTLGLFLAALALTPAISRAFRGAVRLYQLILMFFFLLSLVFVALICKVQCVDRGPLVCTATLLGFVGVDKSGAHRAWETQKEVGRLTRQVDREGFRAERASSDDGGSRCFRGSVVSATSEAESSLVDLSLSGMTVEDVSIAERTRPSVAHSLLARSRSATAPAACRSGGATAPASSAVAKFALRGDLAAARVAPDAGHPDCEPSASQQDTSRSEPRPLGQAVGQLYSLEV